MGAEDDAGLGLGSAHDPSDAKIGHFNLISVDKDDIVRFYVTVHDAVGMGIIECFGNGSDKTERFFNR